MISDGRAAEAADGSGTERATLVATLTRAPDDEPAFVAAAAAAGCLELRADRTGDLPAAALRERFDGPLLYTLRSRAEGGKGDVAPAVRAERLLAAAEDGWDLIDLEAGRDLAAGVLDRIPPQRRVLSWHGKACDLPALQRRFASMAETPARLYKLVPAARRPAEALPPLQLLAALGRRDVTAFASGTVASWARLLAVRFGARWIYGAVGERRGAPGQPTVERLVRDYGLPELPPAGGLCGVVGDPVAQSLSPRLHNGAYRELGLPLLYVAFEVERFGDFWLDVVESGVLEEIGLPPVGFSVTAPFKHGALAVAGATSPRAEAVRGANTLVCRDGVWEAETTDPEGVSRPLAARGVELDGVAAAVIGAGGAGRAAAFALARAGAEVVLANRDPERGREAAARVGLPFVPLAELEPERYAVLVNATPAPEPIDPARVAPGTAVVELAYRRSGGGPDPGAAGEDAERPLSAAARAGGGLAVGGREVLLWQAVEQFRLMTGWALPPELGAGLLEIELPALGGPEREAGGR